MREPTSGTVTADESELVVRMQDAHEFVLAPGQFLSIATRGESVVGSLYAFAAEDQSEWLSVGNTRILLGTLRPRPGHRLFSNRRRALLVWVEDSAGGHDLLLPPCAQSGASAPTQLPALERLDEAFARIGADCAHAPDPLNLFLDTRVGADGCITIRPSSAGPGKHVVLRATTGLRCVVLVWSLTQAPAGTGGALAVGITNHRPTFRPAAGR